MEETIQGRKLFKGGNTVVMNRVIYQSALCVCKTSEHQNHSDDRSRVCTRFKIDIHQTGFKIKAPISDYCLET